MVTYRTRSDAEREANNRNQHPRARQWATVAEQPGGFVVVMQDKPAPKAQPQPRHQLATQRALRVAMSQKASESASGAIRTHSHPGDRHETQEALQAALRDAQRHGAKLQVWQETLVTLLATDASVGQLSSAGMNASATVGAAVMAVGWLANMAPDQISHGFVPVTLNGRPLAATAAEADRWLANQMAEQIRQGAPKVGFSAECLYGCDGHSNQVWWLKRQATAKADGHLFWPDDLALVFNFEPVEKADEDPVRDAALGFPIAWQTKPGHNARLVIVTDLKQGDDGKPKVIVASDDKTRIPDAGRGTAQTRIGRELLRAIYASPFFLYGDDDLYPGMVVFNGIAYGWKSLSEQPPIRYRLEEPSATSAP